MLSTWHTRTVPSHDPVARRSPVQFQPRVYTYGGEDAQLVRLCSTVQYLVSMSRDIKDPVLAEIAIRSHNCVRDCPCIVCFGRAACVDTLTAGTCVEYFCGLINNQQKRRQWQQPSHRLCRPAREARCHCCTRALPPPPEAHMHGIATASNAQTHLKLHSAIWKHPLQLRSVHFVLAAHAVRPIIIRWSIFVPAWACQS